MCMHGLQIIPSSIPYMIDSSSASHAGDMIGLCLREVNFNSHTELHNYLRKCDFIIKCQPYFKVCLQLNAMVILIVSCASHLFIDTKYTIHDAAIMQEEFCTPRKRLLKCVNEIYIEGS